MAGKAWCCGSSGGGGGSADVVGVAPGTAVGDARSVDVDVVEGPVGTFTVGGRLTPVWGELAAVSLAGTDLVYPTNTGTPVPGASFTVTEAGVYEVTATLTAEVRDSAPSPANHLVELTGSLLRNGAGVGFSRVLSEYWYDVAGTRRLSVAGTGTINRRIQLGIGDTVNVVFVWHASGTVTGPDGSHGSFTLDVNLGYHKISD